MTFIILELASGGHEIHRAGCPHLKRRPAQYDMVDADTVEEALELYFNSYMQDLGYTADSCHVLHCTKRIR